MSWPDDRAAFESRRDGSPEGSPCAAGGAETNGFPRDEKNLDAAISDLLRALGIAEQAVPPGMRGLRNRLDYQLSATGVLYREVRLTRGWQADAMGLMIGSLRETGEIIALLPCPRGGYAYADPQTGRRVRVTARIAGDIAEEALCFYRPLPMRELRRMDLVRYMAGCLTRWDLAAFAAVAMAIALVGLLTLRLNRVLMGPVIERGDARLLFAAVSFLFFATVSRALFSIARGLLLERMRARLSVNVTAATMMRLLSLPTSFFREHPVGELSQYVSSMDLLCSALMDSIFSASMTGVFSLVYVVQLFAFAPGLALPGLGIVLLTFGASLLSAQAQMRIHRERQDCEARERGLVYALIAGIRRIHLSAAEDRAFTHWVKRYVKRARLTFDPPAAIRLFPVVSTAFSLLGTAVIYFAAVSQHVSVADYYAFNAAYAYVATAFAALTGAMGSIAAVRPRFDRIAPLLAVVPETSDSKETVDGLSGRIEMAHVAFGYEPRGPLLFEDLNLTVPAGQCVAVVGRSGCGKSTLVRLLLGFEQPSRGAVCFDGRDLRQLDLRSLRRHIGAVLQDSRLFSGSIFDNLAIAAPGLKPEEAWAAAETAAIAEDIRNMPMGMRTILSDGGGSLSSGQRQRLLITRAVASRPAILILDEATSALDNRTQQRVFDALERLNCTRIVIAHRLSTVRRCDRILVIDQGRIVEDGAYDALIARGGLFTELAERQCPENQRR